jgi:hypothetical protein
LALSEEEEEESPFRGISSCLEKGIIVEECRDKIGVGATHFTINPNPQTSAGHTLGRVI